jgi:photosystem I subunit 3
MNFDSFLFSSFFSHSKRFFIALFFSLSLSPVFFSFSPFAMADFQNLTPCKDSPTFQKRLVNSVKKIENRLKLYTPESKESIILLNQIDAVKNRFEKYKNANLLCGKEGLPRIIATGQWDHAKEFVFPGILFLYITGWIGWVGRKYLRYISISENSFEKEIIVDVPVALRFMTSGFLWPIESWKEFTSGDLLAKDTEITNSPR